jgi:hypothetical protein
MAALLGPATRRAVPIARFMNACQARGWLIGQVVRREERPDPPPTERRSAHGRPLCLIADADRWSRRQVLELPRLADSLLTPARILLAADDPDRWWNDLGYQLDKGRIHRGPTVRTATDGALP